MKRISIPLLVFGLFLSLPLFAGDGLTSATVRNFIDSLKDIEQLSKKYENDPVFDSAANQSVDQTMQRIESPFSTMTNSMEGSKIYNEFVIIVKRHGFDSAEQWSLVGNRIYRAMAAIQMDKEMSGDMESQMTQAQEKMKSSGMPAEQQRMMMEMMTASRHVMQQFRNVPQTDREVVKPYIAEFEQLGNR